MAGILISAARKSSGKTSFSLGLAALLHARGHKVQTFKKGPDYIDPMWLARSSQRPCINLDFYTMTHGEIEQAYRHYGRGADVVLVEGNKGLHDGMDVAGSDCNAALAKLLDLPVILVIDASGITRGVAPLVHGYQTFDKDIRIAGVVLNKVAGQRHQQKLDDAIARYTDLPVLGAIPRCEDMLIQERHIGLTPSNEDQRAQQRIERIAAVLSNSVDVDRVFKLAGLPAAVGEQPTAPDPGPKVVSIGVARDAAFGFYYADDLEVLMGCGARLHYFDTLRDKALPEVDALFIGGGFPEFHLQQLHDNSALRAEIKRFVDDGRPVYAECGGLMYLCRDISFDGTTRSMVGAVPANAVMTSKPVGRGYVRLRELPQHPWVSSGGDPAETINAHEFHYSRLDNLGEDAVFAFAVVRGAGIQDKSDGLVYKNMLATYSHQRNVGSNHWAERFVDHIRSWKRGGRHQVAVS